MLEQSKYRDSVAPAQRPIDGHDDKVAWLEIVRDGLALHKLFIAFAMMACLFLAVAYLAVAPRIYVARAEMVLDSRASQNPIEDAAANADLELAYIESQVEIMKSVAVLREVVDRTGYRAPLGLAGLVAQQFDGTPLKEAFDAAAAWASRLRPADANADGPGASRSELAEQKRIEAMELRLNVRRLGSSNVISIQFADPDPRMAAQVTNGVIDVYNARQQALRERLLLEHSASLEDQVRRLNENSSAQEQKIAQFKRENEVLTLGLDSAVERQVAEVSAQLALARAQSAEARVRLERLLETGEASAADGSRSEVLTRLRLQFFDIRKRLEEADARYGPGNPASIDLIAERAALERALADEGRRVERSYRSDFDIASARERSLADSLAKVALQAGEGAGKRAALKDMEALAQNFRVMAEASARRLAETGPRVQAAPEGRVITRASPPREKSEPKVAFVLIGALAAGLFVGSGVAIAREYRRNVFRDLTKLKRWTGADCLVAVPWVKQTRAPIGPDPGANAGSDGSTSDFRERFAILRPESNFALQMRRLAAQITPPAGVRAPVVVGVVSPRKGDGASVVAANLAHVLAAGGRSAVLLRLARGDQPAPAAAKQGARRKVSKPEQDHVALEADPLSGLKYAPSALEAYSPVAGGFLPDRVQDLIDTRLQTCDAVVLDIPSINDHSDAAAVAGLIDRFVLVVAANHTSGADLEASLASLPRLREALAAVVLNKCDGRLANA